MPLISIRVAWVPPIHRIDGVEIEHLPLPRMQEAHIVAGGVLIGNHGAGKRQHLVETRRTQRLGASLWRLYIIGLRAWK